MLARPTRESTSASSSDEIWGDVQKRLSRDDRRGKHHIIDPCGALPKGMVHCASCDQPMIHTYPQKRGKPLYRYYVGAKAHRRGWQQCETRSVSAPVLEHAVIERLAGMAANPVDLQRNEVFLALDRAGMFWSQFTEDARQRFIRRLVKQVRYNERFVSVTVQFDPEAFREGTGEGATDLDEHRATPAYPVGRSPHFSTILLHLLVQGSR